MTACKRCKGREIACKRCADHARLLIKEQQRKQLAALRLGA